MSGLGPAVRKIPDGLDALGNPTAAMGKGFAIGSAALTALGLFSAYGTAVRLPAGGLDLVNPLVVIGFFIGGRTPLFFSPAGGNARGRAAGGGGPAGGGRGPAGPRRRAGAGPPPPPPP